MSNGGPPPLCPPICGESDQSAFEADARRFEKEGCSERTAHTIAYIMAWERHERRGRKLGDPKPAGL